MATAPTITPERASKTTRKPYPNFKVVVLNDDVNTFQHVAESLMTYIPNMTSDRAWDLTNQVHFEGQAIVWVGPQEQAELYHQQLRRAGLTMAPLEAAQMAAESGRLVWNHSTHLDGLIPLLEKLVNYRGIRTITPGALSRTKGNIPKLKLRISVPLRGGYKVIARKGKSVQEVFIVTDLSQGELQAAIADLQP